MEKYQFDPKNIFNIDETGCFTVQVPKKALAQGVKQVISFIHSSKSNLGNTVSLI